MNVSGRGVQKLIEVPSYCLLPLACCLLCAVPVAAQSAWPERLVQIIVPAAAGGGTDTVARIMADHFSRAFGQQFMVENRGGAGGIIGIDAVAKAPPDGYMTLVTGSPITSNHLTSKNVPYDALRDFAPISLLVTLPNILNIHPSVPAKSLAELIALAKSKPGELTYASAGLGTNPHFAMELFKHMASVDLRHVPYRGVAPALNDVVAGSVNATLTNILSGKPHAPGRHAPRHGRVEQEAYHRSARCPDFRGSRSRSTRPRSGTASWRLRARLPRSSRACTLKWCGHCRCPTFASA